jgi:hypothetical protein
MRLAPLGLALRLTGLAVGLAAVLALVVGVDPAHIPPFLVKVALYKLTFIAALALLIAGAMVGRRARAHGSAKAPPR